MADLFPQAEIGDLVTSASRRIRHVANRDLEPLGVTWSQMRALRVVAGDTEPIRMSVLADRLHIARRSATSVVDELVGKGLLQRVHDPLDRRAVAVTTTTAGRAMLHEVTRRRRAAAEQITADLTPEEVTTLRDLLRRLAGEPLSR